MEKLRRAIRWDSSEGTPGGPSMGVAMVFLVCAAILVEVGLNMAFTYDESTKLVGGDAYNLQILAARGLAWICAGIAAGLCAVVSAILSIRAVMLAQITARETHDGTILWTERVQRAAVESAARASGSEAAVQ